MTMLSQAHHDLWTLVIQIQAQTRAADFEAEGWLPAKHVHNLHSTAHRACTCPRFPCSPAAKHPDTQPPP